MSRRRFRNISRRMLCHCCSDGIPLTGVGPRSCLGRGLNSHDEGRRTNGLVKSVHSSSLVFHLNAMMVIDEYFGLVLISWPVANQPQAPRSTGWLPICTAYHLGHPVLSDRPDDRDTAD